MPGIGRRAFCPKGVCGTKPCKTAADVHRAKRRHRINPVYGLPYMECDDFSVPLEGLRRYPALPEPVETTTSAAGWDRFSFCLICPGTGCLSPAAGRVCSSQMSLEEEVLPIKKAFPCRKLYGGKAFFEIQQFCQLGSLQRPQLFFGRRFCVLRLQKGAGTVIVELLIAVGQGAFHRRGDGGTLLKDHLEQDGGDDGGDHHNQDHRA